MRTPIHRIEVLLATLLLAACAPSARAPEPGITASAQPEGDQPATTDAAPDAIPFKMPGGQLVGRNYESDWNGGNAIPYEGKHFFPSHYVLTPGDPRPSPFALLSPGPPRDNVLYAISPDLQYLVYEERVYDNPDSASPTKVTLFVAALGGPDPVKVIGADDSILMVNSGPAWSRDSRTLFFYLQRESVIYKYDVSDGSLQALPLQVGNVKELAVSPDGTRIAYAEDGHRGEFPEVIFVATADGSGADLVLETQGSIAELVWHPDGARLLYTKVEPIDLTKHPPEEPNRRVFAFDLAARNEVPIGPGEYSYGINFSPDGRILHYNSGPQNIFLNAEDLTPLPISVISPLANLHWSPDSRHVAYVDFDGFGDDGAVYIIDVQTGAEGSFDPGIQNFDLLGWIP